MLLSAFAVPHFGVSFGGSFLEGAVVEGDDSHLTLHETGQATLVYGHLSMLSHCRPILGLKERNWLARPDYN